ncbi:hypothetical protein SMICM304S_06086 [Streptomyces microflavus]
MRVIDVQRQDTYFDLPLMITFNGGTQGPAYLRLEVDAAIDLVDELNLALDVRVRGACGQVMHSLRAPDARRADPCTCGPRRRTGLGVVLTPRVSIGALAPEEGCRVSNPAARPARFLRKAGEASG